MDRAPRSEVEISIESDQLSRNLPQVRKTLHPNENATFALFAADFVATPSKSADGMG